MPTVDSPPDHLSDYERAICYFALPRVISPVNPGLIAAYAVCLSEAVGALLIGLILHHHTWILAGSISLWGIIFLGVVIFTGRALLNDFRQRRLLDQARGVPDARKEANDLPDPFEGHLLLQHPAGAEGRLFACNDADAVIRYFVDNNPRERRWNIRTPQDAEVCSVTAYRHWWSWSLGSSGPCSLTVRSGETLIAHVYPVFSFAGGTLRIQCLSPETHTYMIRQFGIYDGKTLVGRIYALRDSFYLDIDETHFNESILAYFVSLS